LYLRYGLDDAMLAVIKEMVDSEIDHIHDLGCGQSNLCELLRTHGFKSLSASDFSAVLIERRQEEESKRAALMGDPATIIKYVTCDLRERLPMPRRSVKLIVDKATLDAITHRQSREAARDAKRVLSRAVEMLSDGGKMLSISLSNDEVFNKYCEHPSLAPVTATRKLVRRIAGQPKPVNVYIRKFKLVVSRS